MDKTEGNRLIAEFDKKTYWQVFNKDRNKPYWSDRFSSKEECDSTIRVIRLSDKLESRLTHEMEYDTNWNDLMPVVEKIEEIKYHKSNAFSVDFGRGYCVVYHNDVTQKSIIVKTGNSKIEAAWEAVVSFIKWYNKQQEA